MAEVLTGKPSPMSAFEFTLWIKFRQFYGFSTDRIECTSAIGSAYIANALNADIRPTDVLAKFGPRKRDSKSKLVSTLAGLNGAKIEFVPHGSTKPTLTGKQALAKLLDEENADWDEAPRGRKTLDGKQSSSDPPKPKNRRTLDG